MLSLLSYYGIKEEEERSINEVLLTDGSKLKSDIRWNSVQTNRQRSSITR